MLWGGDVTYQCAQCDNMYIKRGQLQCMLHNGSTSFVAPDVRHYYFYISNYYFGISTKDEKNKNIDYYFCFLKEFWFTKLFRKAASLKIQVRYDNTVCCLQKLFHLGWLGSHLKLNGCKLLNSFSDQFPYYKISTHVP